MEGRTIVRPDSPALPVIGVYSSILQWRAGQSSGQTPHHNQHFVDRPVPSMEGRTIVRPDIPSRLRPVIASALQWRAGQSSGQTGGKGHFTIVAVVPSMEGRTIVRPDLALDIVTARAHHPSMEGRTIVRPDGARRQTQARSPPPFNGGPDNRPARPGPPAVLSSVTLLLQWRAGQSSGQTKPSPTEITQTRTLQWRAGQSSGQT